MQLPLLFALLALPMVALAHPGGVDENGCHKDSGTGKQHCHADRAKANDKPRYDAAHPPKAGDEAVFYGPVVRVVDGDTFKAKVQGVVMQFRLEAIDAPEHDQPHGEQAKRELLSMIGGQQVVLVPSDTDRYGRTVVRVWVGTLDVNREMVKRGAAWFESEYSKDAVLYEEENRARDQKRGLWALTLKDRIEPWVWRRRENKTSVGRAASSGH
jgi:endonuclease YncB( thermonuclease family)